MTLQDVLQRRGEVSLLGDALLTTHLAKVKQPLLPDVVRVIPSTIPSTEIVF